jgi:hypothetical protein
VDQADTLARREPHVNVIDVRFDFHSIRDDILLWILFMKENQT